MSPASRQAFPKSSGKQISNYLDERQCCMAGGGGRTWVLDVDLGSDHNSGPYCATLCRAFNCLASNFWSQSKEYENLYFFAILKWHTMWNIWYIVATFIIMMMTSAQPSSTTVSRIHNLHLRHFFLFSNQNALCYRPSSFLMITSGQWPSSYQIGAENILMAFEFFEKYICMYSAIHLWRTCSRSIPVNTLNSFNWLPCVIWSSD